MKRKVFGLIIVSIVLVIGFLDASISPEFPITTEGSDHWYARIYGDIVVWTDWRNSPDFRDIYAYNLSKSQEIRITYESNRHQQDPSVYGDIIVWHDWNTGGWNADIYGYNLSTSTKFPICTDNRNQWYPAIYGDIVVWVD
ncbi:MAG: hypothetical protein PVF58_12185 [Candidatus Methanofastidiosia archaeon]|jgi:beta propeller repeat protein